ncbi:MAG: 4Fe-4S binding protein [Candidatus Zixiibacteriota bacterium]
MDFLRTQPATPFPQEGLSGRKKRSAFIRRRPDGTIDWRFWSQAFWTAVCVWIGYEFWQFVRFHETGASGPAPARPPGVESFLPISGLLGLRDWFLNGVLNNIHPAATIILGLAIVSSVLLKRSFCGWVCPVGFLSEAVGNAGIALHRWKGKLPRLLDWPLRSLKYLLLAFFAYAVFVQMTPTDLTLFINSPYNKVADIKMLKFFSEIDAQSLWIILGLVGLGFIINGFWCRYLCPYGALAGFVSLVSPFKIRRVATSCIDCNKCNVACPAHIPVMQLNQVRSDECNACLACVQVCPAADALSFSLPKGKKPLSRRAMLVAVTGIFVLGIGLAQLSGHWDNTISQHEYRQRISELNSPKYEHNRGQVPEYGPGE